MTSLHGDLEGTPEIVPNALIRRLGSLTALGAGDEAALSRLCQSAIACAAGRSLAEEGQKPQAAFLLLEGWACRYTLMPDGRRQITAILLPGDMCDPFGFVLPRFDHSICLLTDARVAFVADRTVIEMTRRHPTIARAFLWSTLVEQAVGRQWLVNVGRRNAQKRTAHLFCELRSRLQQVGLVDGDGFDLPFTQEQLGDVVGLTPVHVNRTLKALRDQGLATLVARRLTILDYDRLQHVAGFNPDYLHVQSARPAQASA